MDVHLTYIPLIATRVTQAFVRGDLEKFLVLENDKHGTFREYDFIYLAFQTAYYYHVFIIFHHICYHILCFGDQSISFVFWSDSIRNLSYCFHCFSRHSNLDMAGFSISNIFVVASMRAI